MEDRMIAIGVDGGGTKTVAWLGSQNSSLLNWRKLEILGVGKAGPSNPLSVGFEVATNNLADAIDAAFVAAKMQPITVDAACFCLAGAGRQQEQSRILAWTREAAVAKRVEVIHDGTALLADAQLDNGVAVISGTGSFAWGKTADGRTARCGGWGYLIDDGGSGYWIGIEALKAVARAADGRAPKTELTQAVLERFQLAELTEIKSAIYPQPAPHLPSQYHSIPRGTIAAFAEDVFRVSSSCPVAAGIITRAVKHVADLARSVICQLQQSGKIHNFESSVSDLANASPSNIIMGGGVLAGQSEFRDEIVRELERTGAKVASVTVIRHPVSGALKLAMSRCDGFGGDQQ